MSDPTIVMLDTNALMMPAQLNVRLFAELERLLGEVEPVVPDAVLAELDRIASEGSPDEAAAARVGRSLADERARRIESESGGADPAIATLARDGAADYVVTNDAPLRNRVLDAGIPVISLRGRTKLSIIQP